ncbi:MAG: AAC(3) family N-acetyltransferase [bacterium]
MSVCTLIKEARAAAGRFRALRVQESVKSIWSHARWMDTPAVQRAAETVAGELRRAGLQNVKIETIPADGTTDYGGWIMPVAWSVKEARLELRDPVTPDPVLIDYAKVPQGLAMYSPGTPGGRWVEGPVIASTDAYSVRRQLKGAFLLLEGIAGSFEATEAAAEAGALGVLVCGTHDDRKASRYLNYAVSPAADRLCIPCFSLSPEVGDRVRALLGRPGGLRLRARVKAGRKAGTMPLVTATLGPANPSLYICAHLDEPGAQDNASGVAVALEVVRILRALEVAPGFRDAKRGVRVFFSTEVRGVQAWVNRVPKENTFIAGINLDMVGHDLVPVVLRGGFRDQPHFARHLLREAAQIADQLVKGIPTKTGFNYVSDAILKTCQTAAHVSIEQAVDSTYHTSSDEPDRLKLRTIRWVGSTATAFLYSAMRMDNDDILRLARVILTERDRELREKTGKAEVIGRRVQHELESLRRLMTVPELYGDRLKPEDLYREGVSRATGCWPEVAQQAELDRLIAGHAGQKLSRAGCSYVPGGTLAVAHKEATRLVPQILFNGFLTFEDEWRPDQASALKKALGLSPAWGTEGWAWMLARQFRGKSTVAEVVNKLAMIGVEIDMEKAVRLAQHLVQTGKARLMPMITPSVLREKLKAVGLKRGGLVVAHCSLSNFGYVQGGSATVVDVLLDLVGPRGTLAMPTHTNSVLGAQPYDRKLSPSLVGAVTEYFRTRPGVFRSAHPTHSVAAFGPAARDLTEAHKVTMSPMDRAGFWGRLVDLEGDVLLLCPIRSATLFHAGEDWTGVPQPVLIAHAIGPDNRRRVHILPHAPWHVDHFESTMAAPLLKQGLMRSMGLGDGVIYHVPARAVADISVKVNQANPLVSLGKGGTCTCFYCKTLRNGIAAILNKKIKAEYEN